jgi:HSP20 family molecular chaperone IbpA
MLFINTCEFHKSAPSTFSGLTPAQSTTKYDVYLHQHLHVLRIAFDIWESSSNNNKIVVAFDVPGSEMEMLDIYITRFAITISRKIGVFEERFLTGKYKPYHLQVKIIHF